MSDDSIVDNIGAKLLDDKSMFIIPEGIDFVNQFLILAFFVVFAFQLGYIILP